MDPDANIAAQRLLIARLSVQPGDQAARHELTELSQALRDWLAGGGFSPDAPDWRHVQQAAGRVLSRHWRGRGDRVTCTRKCRAWGMPVPRPGPPHASSSRNQRKQGEWHV